MKTLAKQALLLTGLLIFAYLILSLKYHYAWGAFAGGFGGSLILFPITVVLGIICILFQFILPQIVKSNKILNILTVGLVVISLGWLILLQGLSLSIENEWHGKPKGVLLDSKTKLGELLPDTKWVESGHDIYYISTDKKFYPGALCSINVNGANRKKIIENCRYFGFLPNGSDMFVFSGNALYLLRGSDGIEEKILTFGAYEDMGRKVSAVSFILWSPDGNKFYFAERDKDTNGDGKISWHDRPTLYLFKVSSQAKEKIDFDDFAHIELCKWNKSGSMLYISYTKVFSENDVRRYLCSYDLDSKKMNVLVERNFDQTLIMKDYIGDDELFDLSLQGTGNASSVSHSIEIKPKNGIGLKTERYGSSLYIQRESQPPKKIFEYIGSLGYDVGYRPAVYNFLWLPGDRYILCSIKNSICVLDTKSERIGILTQGYTASWFNMQASQ